MKKNLLGVLALALAAMTLFAACSSGGGGTDTTAGTTAGTTAAPTTTAPAPVTEAGETARTDLIIGMVGEPKTMDLTEVSDLVSFSVFFNIYDNLIRFDADDVLRPGVAESWEFSDDGLQLTFKLRDDVYFWNGDKMTAEDVSFSINKAIVSSYTNTNTSMMENMEVVDDSTVVLNLKFAYGPVEYCLGSAQMGIIQKKHFEDVGGTEGFSRNPMGTGAYILESWAAGDKLTLVANDNYFRGEPKIKNITYKILTDGTTAVLALQNGEIDLLDTPPAADRATLMADEKLTYLETPIAASVFVDFNNIDEVFSDKRMRKAVMMTVDKEAMIEGAREGLGMALNTYWPIPLGGWDSNRTIDGIPYDVEGAKALIEEAGYGSGLEVELRTTDSATYNKPTEVLQDMLSQAGITGTINRMERTAFFESVQTERNFQMSVLASTTGGLPDVDYIYGKYHSSFIDGGRNYCAVNNADVDRLLEAGRASSDQNERYDIYYELAELFVEEVFVGPLYSYYTPIAHAKDLQGVIINSANRMFAFDFWWAA